ncbi:MAG TPA: hypothetical protein DCP68_02715 [Ruminococcus sp.]|nr:hypothetical protein [Ruminococcus sp.]
MTDEKIMQQDIPLKLIHMDEVEATNTRWLWYPYIPYGKITIIQGDPSEGKTTLVLHLAAELTQGKMFESEEQQEPVTVIYQTAEDGLADTIKPRLIAANADCSKVLVIDETEQCVSMTDGRLEAAIQQTNAKLVILDPIQAYLGAAVDMHRANEVRPIMAHLGNIAEKYGCAIVLIGHMNKSSGQKASYRGLGSIDFAAAARSVLIVARDRENPQIRVMIHAKSSLAPEGKPVAFELDKDNGFRYLGEYDGDPNELLSGSGGKKKSKLAEELLLSELEAGAKAQKDILAKAEECGISKRTMIAAKKAIGVQSEKKSDGWYWSLPDNNARMQECKDNVKLHPCTLEQEGVLQNGTDSERCTAAVYAAEPCERSAGGA